MDYSYDPCKDINSIDFDNPKFTLGRGDILKLAVLLPFSSKSVKEIVRLLPEMERYIADHFADKNVIMLGDFNDILTDTDENNVFNVFLDQPEKYAFTDMTIAEGSAENWSYPGWPSHLDHILITNELFDEFDNTGSTVQTIPIEDYLEGGWSDYEKYISDHRPVVLSLNFNPERK